MDHARVNIDCLPISCGVYGLSRISDDVDDALYAIASRLYHPSRGTPCAAFVFSNRADIETNAHRLFFRVEALGFNATGTWYSVGFENPKTSNMINVYLWVVDHEAFKKWYGKQRVARLEKVGS